MHDWKPAQKREFTSRIRSVLLLFALTIAVVLSACEAPTGVSDVEATASGPNALRSNSAVTGIIVDADGTERPITAKDIDAFSAEGPGEQGVALMIAGAATFDNSTFPALRLNVRQTGGGAIAGQGRVTMRDQTTDVTPVCVKKRELWGRSYYGITMELDEPHNRHGTEYEYATVTVTGDGQLSPGAIYRHTPVCGYSAALYPEAPVTGHINVTHTGR